MSLVSANVPIAGTSVSVGGGGRRHHPTTGIVLVGTAEILSHAQKTHRCRLSVAYIRVPDEPTQTFPKYKLANKEISLASSSSSSSPPEMESEEETLVLSDFLSAMEIAKDHCQVVYIATVNGSTRCIQELADALHGIGVRDVRFVKAPFTDVRMVEGIHTEYEAFKEIIHQWSRDLKESGRTIQESLEDYGTRVLS